MFTLLTNSGNYAFRILPINAASHAHLILILGQNKVSVEITVYYW
jgi:hypothetical protein